MDFLILFVLYVVLVLLSILFCLFSGRKHSAPSRVVALGSQVLLCLFPAQALKAFHRLFHTRNSLFVVLNFVLEVLVYVEYSWEVIGYCVELEFHFFVLLLPYLLLLVNLGFFLLCSKTDPGTITKSNQAQFLHIYPYDGVMFKDTECPTCAIKKPARSKHCGVCNVCVHRFDHHCVWVNNCIGAFNMRYFVLYLFSLLAMATAIAIITVTFLIQVVVMSNMMLGHYLDDRGQEHQVNVVFLIQHLFLTFPRIVFMLGFVILISLIMGFYFCFTLYLILTNQTSNEWFKATRYKCLCSEHCTRHSGYKNVYSRGILGNLMEILRPLTRVGKSERESLRRRKLRVPVQHFPRRVKNTELQSGHFVEQRGAER